MVFVGTSVFTRKIQELVSDEEYRKLQQLLLARPCAGDLMRGCGGLRKIRVARYGKGKRGGVRVIYCYLTEDARIYMLYAYAKNEQSDLTERQWTLLKRLVEEELQ